MFYFVGSAATAVLALLSACVSSLFNHLTERRRLRLMERLVDRGFIKNG